MDRKKELATMAKVAVFLGESEKVFINKISSFSTEDQEFSLKRFQEYRLKFALLHGRSTIRRVSSPYIRAGVLPIDFVLKHAGIKEVAVGSIAIGSAFCSWRIRCYATKGVVCAYCGMRGDFFAIEKNASQNTDKFHLNLYHVSEKGNQVLMTVDHIFPKSKGGSNDMSNLQPLCSICNFKKSDKIETPKEVA